MTLQMYSLFRETRVNQDNDPLIEKWISLLGLENINITIIQESGKNGYVGITLHYNDRLEQWIITLNFSLDLYHDIN